MKKLLSTLLLVNFSILSCVEFGLAYTLPNAYQNQQQATLALLKSDVPILIADGQEGPEPPRPACSRIKGGLKFQKTKAPKKEFKNRDQAIDFLRGREVGEANPKLTPTLGAQTSTTTADGSPATSIKVSFNIDPKSSSVTLPDWSWPNMLASDRKALQDFLDQLENHERGHICVAYQVAKCFSKTITVPNTPAGKPDTKAIQKALNELQQTAQSELDSLAGSDGQYDTVTDHGRNQSAGSDNTFKSENFTPSTCGEVSFPGGKNVELKFPAPPDKK